MRFRGRNLRKRKKKRERERERSNFVIKLSREYKKGFLGKKSEIETCRRENGNIISGKNVREKACICLETCLSYPM